ncbi:MAG: ABC transporter permease, partial [Bacteroidales bacterium]|nr:ABC transporter permease [Bacteroidales bacterium]
MSVGMSIALLIGFWGLHEFSFDSFHSNADRIYRICRQGYINNESTIIGSDFSPVGVLAKQKFPQIEDFCRVIPMEREPLKIRDTKAYEDNICVVDANFFSFFSFKLENGNPETCVDAPDKIVIDRRTADKYFPNEDPVGQTIEVYGREFHVSAVMNNMPENSHLRFNILVPLSAIQWLRDSSWGNNDNFMTYLLLNEGADPELLAGKITGMTYENEPIYEKLKITHFLQPLTEIHFSPGFRFDRAITSDQRVVFMFISLAILILLIACFNFINMFISTSFLRAKSIGVKKLNGSSRASLLFSSYLETGLYILISTLIAIIMVGIMLPYFNQMLGYNLHFNFRDYRIYLYAAALIFSTIIISGTFPVVYMLRFNPEAIIRNRFKGSGVTLLQRVLVISQFVASIMLISSAGLIKKQIRYVENMDLGFNKEQILYVYPRNLAGNYMSVRDELLRNPNVVDVTAKNCLPSEWQNGGNVALAGNVSVEKIMEICLIQANYPDMMEIPLAEGRNPFLLGQVNTTDCLINQQAAESLDLKDPVGMQLLVGGSNYTIAGVLKDANTKSLHLKVDPQVFVAMNEVHSYYSIMIKANGQYESVIRNLSRIWDQYNPDAPFEYFFLNDAYDQLYKSEKTASNIISVGMVFSLCLAFMGLYAISHYATERRVKEIGVRKVNGARVFEVLVLLNRDFIRWILIAVAVATPVTWFILYKWLENFAYKTALSGWIFVVSGLLALGIAILTVSWQSWRAATRNPVQALRYE